MSITFYQIKKDGKRYKIIKSYYQPTPDEEEAKRKLTKRKAELIFGVNLKNREYSITFDLYDAEITFFDKGQVFGWLERLPKADFWKTYAQLKNDNI